ncbi:hypothetical protein EVAR_66031_1 [Eumeta japonica]|uniref:Uncharacterized protein n=1 Tax=Eumeta variegata TaxID=151549 RepID=A0A4C1Z9K8_EUMVA|nr:hypothetical protein EVAR_66031_1 [Eumeta japonica]
MGIKIEKGIRIESGTEIGIENGTGVKNVCRDGRQLAGARRPPLVSYKSSLKKVSIQCSTIESQSERTRCILLLQCGCKAPMSDGAKSWLILKSETA